MSKMRLPALVLAISMIIAAVLPAFAQNPVELGADVVPQSNNEPGFQPVVRLLGLRESSSMIEWVVTVSNVGDTAGQNVVLRDELPDGLRVDNVKIATGTASIADSAVVVIIPALAPQETIQFSIFTRTISDALITNSICASADNYTDLACAEALPVQALPSTGETPQWRTRLQWMSLIIVSVSLLMIGAGLLGWQLVHENDNAPDSPNIVL